MNFQIFKLYLAHNENIFPNINLDQNLSIQKLIATKCIIKKIVRL